MSSEPSGEKNLLSELWSHLIKLLRDPVWQGIAAVFALLVIIFGPKCARIVASIIFLLLLMALVWRLKDQIRKLHRGATFSAGIVVGGLLLWVVLWRFGFLSWPPAKCVPFRGTCVDVHAYAEPPWQDTGINVRPGDRITIVQVGGQWKYAADRGYFDANGDPEWVAPEFVQPSSTIGTLIGSIGGESGPVFPIGRWGVYTSTIAGRLYLTINDNPQHIFDNEGFITVQILVEGAD